MEGLSPWMGEKMPSPFLFVKEVSDLYIRKNFEVLRDYFGSNNQFNGFTTLEFTCTANENNKKIAHGLGFAPKDVLVTRLLSSAGGKLSLNHGLFTSSQLDVSVTGLATGGSMKVRLIVGTLQNSTGDVSVESTETQEFQSKV